MTIEAPERLSYSSLSTYAECGTRWLLERGHEVPSGTWFATIAGSAIHEITEDRDRMEFNGFSPEEQREHSRSFAEVFTELVKEARDEGLEIKASGRKLNAMGENGGPNKKDFDWWLHWGPIYIERWMAWKAKFGWEILVIDGVPGIEIGFDTEIGGQRVVGYIDRLYQSPDYGRIIIDLKTGAMPSSQLQLKTYDVGLRRDYDIEADWGMYWRPGGGDEFGGLSHAYDLREWSDEDLDNMYAAAWRGIQAGIFLPNVSNMCGSCSVRSWCWAVRGGLASTLAAFPEVVNPVTGELAEPATDV